MLWPAGDARGNELGERNEAFASAVAGAIDNAAHNWLICSPARGELAIGRERIVSDPSAFGLDDAT
jgi:hypothetical protein